METFIFILTGILIGLSVSAILAWLDDDRNNNVGILWIIYGGIGIGCLIAEIYFEINKQ